jgi:hypothetical protein
MSHSMPFYLNLCQPVAKSLLVDFYRRLWNLSSPSPSRDLVLAILEYDVVRDFLPPRESLPVLVLHAWPSFLPRFLSQIGHTGMGEQLLLPSGEWEPNLAPEKLFACLTAPFDQQPKPLSAAFDVPLDSTYFDDVGFESDETFEDVHFQKSTFNGDGPLGNIMPPGYGRLIDPIRHSGARLFMDMYTGAMIMLTWPRNEKNRQFMKRLLKDVASDGPNLNARQYGLSSDTIGGMMDGSSMDGCQTYFVQGDRSFNIEPELYVAVVALETAAFVTLPLYTVHSRSTLDALQSTARLARRMTGRRRGDVKEYLDFAWHAVMNSLARSGNMVDGDDHDAINNCRNEIDKVEP